MAEIDQILANYTKSQPDTPTGLLLGASFIVQDKHGKTLYSKAAGKLTFDSDSPILTVDAVGWIASLSKLATTVSAMQLVEEGLIKLDDDVGKLIPQLSNMDIITSFENGESKTKKQTKPITLRHLLTHSSGLAYDTFDPTLSEWAKTAGRTVDTNSYSLEGYSVPLIFEPGEGWVYGVSLDWVGHLVSVLTNSKFEEYLERRIFKPLGMSSTTFRLAQRPDLVKKRAAIGLRADPTAPLTGGGSDPVPAEPEMAGGGSGLFSTAADYAKLLGALIKGGGGILQAETVREMCQPQLPNTKALMANFENPYLHDVFCCEYPAGTPANYALAGAVNLQDIPGKRRRGSIMWSGMSNPHWWLDLESGVAVVLFTQVLPPGDPIVKDLYDELERAVYRSLLH